MLPYFDFDEQRVCSNYGTVNPDAPLFRVSSRSGDGIRDLADFITEKAGNSRS